MGMRFACFWYDIIIYFAEGGLLFETSCLRYRYICEGLVTRLIIGSFDWRFDCTIVKISELFEIADSVEKRIASGVFSLLYSHRRNKHFILKLNLTN